MSAQASEGEAHVVLTERESQVVELLVEGKSHKRIARELGLALGTVNHMVVRIASRTPGAGSPSFRIRRYFWQVAGGSTEAISPPSSEPTGSR